MTDIKHSAKIKTTPLPADESDMNRPMFDMVFVVAVVVASQILNEGRSELSAALAAHMIIFPAAFGRYINMGKNPCWSLLVFIPVISIFVFIYCFITAPRSKAITNIDNRLETEQAQGVTQVAAPIPVWRVIFFIVSGLFLSVVGIMGFVGMKKIGDEFGHNMNIFSIIIVVVMVIVGIKSVSSGIKLFHDSKIRVIKTHTTAEGPRETKSNSPLKRF